MVKYLNSISGAGMSTIAVAAMNNNTQKRFWFLAVNNWEKVSFASYNIINKSNNGLSIVTDLVWWWWRPMSRHKQALEDISLTSELGWLSSRHKKDNACCLPKGMDGQCCMDKLNILKHCII